MAPKVLVVLTSHDHLDDGRQIGWYLPEFAHPYYALVGTDESNPKVEITVASPAGKVAPLDKNSVAQFTDDESVKFLNTQQKLWQETRPLDEFLGKSSEFDAIFYPGGHGPMFDLVKDKTSIKLIEEFYKAGKPVAAVCHGPVVFVNVTIDGEPLLKGRKVTGFSNAEEDAAQLTDAMPELLENALKRVGAKYSKADELFGEEVVIDGQVITGQNPASARGVGAALAKAIGI
ncbi:hypothetical protein G7046_g2897 [Stylonectria norvegica]|nr:hypothetical protein G7046_g2897 [Stylonectria norvegica]